MDREVIKVGTRASLLAIAQATLVRDCLRTHARDRRVELETVVTTGDRQKDQPLAEFGGKGLFVKELEVDLLAGKIDLAVHSAKDLPVELPAGLMIAATPARAAPNDLWIGWEGKSIAELPAGAVVGTSSLRRQAQLLTRRPDVQVQPLRGNIDTRLKKVRDGLVAGTFLAQAGLERTRLLPPTAHILPVDEFIPAGGQGVLAIQTRKDDLFLQDMLRNIHDPLTATALAFERAVIRRLAGNCLAPIGVCALPRGTVHGQTQPGWIVRAFVGLPDGGETARAALLTDDPTPVGLHSLLPRLLAVLEQRGAGEILRRIAGE